VAFSLVAAGTCVAQDVAELLRLAPDETNAVAVIQVGRLHESPLGKQENWADQHSLNFLRGAMSIPPWARLVVRAAHVKPGVPRGEWNIGMAVHPQGIDLTSTRAAGSEELDQIQQHPALVARNLNGYFVEVRPATASQDGIMAVLAPATRQDVARWLDEVDQNRPMQLSDFLVESTQDSDAGIVVALDMRHMVDADSFRTRLEFTNGLVGDTTAIDSLVELIEGLRGVKFELRVTDSMQGRVVLVFSRPIGDEGQYLHQILRDVMHDSQAAIDELADARVSFEG